MKGACCSVSVYMCVLQSIASNSEREFNLSAADTPASHSARMLVKDALVATALRTPSQDKEIVFLQPHRAPSLY